MLALWKTSFPQKEATVWTSTILVYFAGSTANVAEVAETLDYYDMLAVCNFANDKCVITGYSCSRILRSPGQSYIKERISAFGEPDAEYPP